MPTTEDKALQIICDALRRVRGCGYEVWLETGLAEGEFTVEPDGIRVVPIGTKNLDARKEG